jgi:hypothetical protein
MECGFVRSSSLRGSGGPSCGIPSKHRNVLSVIWESGVVIAGVITVVGDVDEAWLWLSGTSSCGRTVGGGVCTEVAVGTFKGAGVGICPGLG